jgi:hypothetical protein
MFYLPGGPMAAIALGMVLFPLRAWTNAANFTFLFLALILVVAELGGRAAAIATAATAALSLDFFLTEPYLSLRIAGRHDLLAFLGLMLCGLVAADLGARSRERLRFLRAARARLQLVHEALLRAGEPPDRWEIAALLRFADLRPGSARRRGRGDRRGPGRARRASAAGRHHRRGAAAGRSGGRRRVLAASLGRVARVADRERPSGRLARCLGDGEPAGSEERRVLSDLGAALAMQLGR